MKKISEDKPLEEKAKDKVVEIYQSEDKIENISDKSFFYEDEELKQGNLYAYLCQAKVKDFSIAALGSLMETLHISEDSHIKV